MRVIGKDRTGCGACNPLDEIIARIEQLERRVVTIVARVQGIPPDATGNVTLPTSDSVDGPLYGNVGAFAMSSEVKEAADDAHQYASAIADDVVVLQSDVEILSREVEALDPASVTALEQSVTALQQSVNQLSNTVAGYSAVIGDLEDQLPNKVDRTGDTMAGPLNVIDTATGSRNAQAVNGNRLQNDLDNYGPMVRTVGDFLILGQLSLQKLLNGIAYIPLIDTSTPGISGGYKIIAQLRKSELTGARNHYTVKRISRTRDRGYDEMVFYTSNGALQGFTMQYRGNTQDNLTYVLSQDDDFVYLSQTSTGTAQDQTIAFISDVFGDMNKFITPVIPSSRDVMTIPGVEYARLTA